MDAIVTAQRVPFCNNQPLFSHLSRELNCLKRVRHIVAK